jgi:hypothetical protein
VTTYYGVSAPLGSGKTTAAVEFSGHAARVGEKFVIAQPSIKLINQSLRQFRERWPNVAVRAIHSSTTSNVAREIASHTKTSSNGEVLFITHSSLLQCPYWNRGGDWNLIIDEAPQTFYNAEFTLPVNYRVLLPALEAHPYNVRYSRLIPGDAALSNEIAENRGNDQVNALFQEFVRRLKSDRWNMFVLSEQFERFQRDEVSDGKLLVFGLIDPRIFDGFASVAIMSANLQRTIVYQHLVQAGHSFATHEAIEKRLRFRKHENGDLLTIHYAVDDGNWSKHKRDKSVLVEGETFSVNDLIVGGAMELFGEEEFVWLANKDIEDTAPFEGAGIMLPHSPHGLNCFQHIHNAAVLPALNPSPALYGFLDEVAHLNSDEVRQAVYHESVYQAAGRISTRNSADETPKHLVVADRAAAEALAELYPGADVVRLPFSDLIPEGQKVGRRRIHASDTVRKAEHRNRHKSDLLTQLDQVNGFSSETKLPYSYKVNSSLTDATFGGSLFHDIGSKYPAMNLSGISPSDFIEFLRDLHTRNVAKPDAWLWSPAEFESKAGVDTGRGLANITAIHGVFLDNDGGDLRPDEFAGMFPYLMMVIHNSSSSSPDHTKWRAIIPTTCAMTIDVHREVMLQIRQALNRRDYFDKRQLEKRAKKGLGGKCHGFDPSKYTASSMFYLPGQATACPVASFFLTFDDGKRHAINPYQWIDKTIINHQPEPEPELLVAPSNSMSFERKDPKLTRALKLMEAEQVEHRQTNYQERVEAAMQRWRYHGKGTGNHEFFVLAASLAANGMDRIEIQQTLYAESVYAHGAMSQRDRRAAIPDIMNRLRCAS